MSDPKIRVDWTIPVWSVAGLIGQAVAIAWWGASITQRVSALEERSDPSEEVARLDERTKAMAEAMVRIERKLDR